MENFNDSKKLVSVYNEAQLQILRLNNIWIKCHEAVKNGNLISYKWQLDRAWIELTADAQKQDKDLYFKAMKKHIISTDKAPAAIGIYSQAVAINGGTTIYLSGQIPLIPETMEIVEGGIEEQIHQVFNYLF